MIKMKIIRDKMDEQGAFGKLYIEGVYLCETLEPDITDKVGFYIPAGVYPCKRFHGNKWKNTFEILVEGHTALLFHVGNTEKDTKGCVLLGLSRGRIGEKEAVFSSKLAFSEFMDATNGVDTFELTIEDRY